jgi:pyruvate ferredoxin oxidoreductase alpha subunit
MIGSFAAKAKDAVDRLREAGRKVGLLRLRLVRPFPEEKIRRLLEGKKGVAVVDQNISMGKGGILYMELSSALYGRSGQPLITSYIGGLGGRDITPEEFFEMEAETRSAAEKCIAPLPRLLYTETELLEIRKLQAIALGERRGTGNG